MFTNSLNYYLACFFFNTFPIPQREAGARHTLQYIGEVTGSGTSILLFPEGMRSPTGQMKPFRGGIGMIASRLDLPVVPVRIEDVDRADARRVLVRPSGARSAWRSAHHSACAATITPRWRRRSRRRCGTSDRRLAEQSRSQLQADCAPSRNRNEFRQMQVRHDVARSSPAMAHSLLTAREARGQKDTALEAERHGSAAASRERMS